MTVPKATDVLALSADSVAAFIQEQASAKTLSGMMRQLNDDLMSGDTTASEMAGRALAHLGFQVDP